MPYNTQPQEVPQHTSSVPSKCSDPAAISHTTGWPSIEIAPAGEKELFNGKGTHNVVHPTGKMPKSPSVSGLASSTRSVEREVIEISSSTDEEVCPTSRRTKTIKSQGSRKQSSGRSPLTNEFSTNRKLTTVPTNPIFPLLQKRKDQSQIQTTPQTTQKDVREIIYISDTETDYDSSVPRPSDKESLNIFPINRALPSGIRAFAQTQKDDPKTICTSDAETDCDSSAPRPSDSPVKERLAEHVNTSAWDILDSEQASYDPAILTFDPRTRARPVPRTPSQTNKPSSRNNQVSLTSTNILQAQQGKSVSTGKRKITTEQQRLRDYAKALFSELNSTVFGGRIPPETELIWNVRLLSTAGKAFFSRNQQDQTYTKIELAPKLLDCDERVKLTLAHEMCHLAVWVIDNDPSEAGHGRQFKAWASRTTQARPDIIISTKHSYTINYTHKWECVECGKIYGRFSNSINIETHGCSACTPAGKLRPLFPVRGKRKATSESKLATDSPHESPRALAPSSSKSPGKTRSISSHIGFPVEILSSDDEIEQLVQCINAVSIEEQNEM